MWCVLIFNLPLCSLIQSSLQESWRLHRIFMGSQERGVRFRHQGLLYEFDTMWDLDERPQVLDRSSNICRFDFFSQLSRILADHSIWKVCLILYNKPMCHTLWKAWLMLLIEPSPATETVRSICSIIECCSRNPNGGIMRFSVSIGFSLY